MKMNKQLKTAIFLASAMGCLAVPANAALTIIATDIVETDGYTYVNPAGFLTLRTSGDQGLTAQAGTKFASLSNTSTSGTGSRSLTFTAGFGPTITVQAGTYQVSAQVGEGLIARSSFSTFDLFLKTIGAGATEFANRSDVIVYVFPNTPATAEWTTTIAQYTVAEGSALIGKQFTWGANFTVSGSHYAAWDDVEVSFEAIPEPSATALLGLGGLALILRRRRK